MRDGPRRSDGPQYLFALKLQDDSGEVEAVAAGADARRLLPGAPSPAKFRADAGVRARVERALAGAEAPDSGGVRLRLRSYLAPLGGIGHGGEKCKRYSIVAPSCFEEGPQPAEGDG